MEATGIARAKGRVEGLYTLPNFITALRTVLCLGIFSVAAYSQDMSLNLVGLIIYWSLDWLDGYLARSLDQETIIGAQFDILSDRLLIAYFYLNYLFIAAGPVLIVSLFLLNFMVLDHFLSNQYLRWPLISPNYFYQVDRIVWAL
ncbi:MAG: alcohol phosphatidyltransferase, partial [Armatimonadetes bacterium]|nr:alcohol phosphatidyltransferase [Armatimonadota bacterium]NIN07002.1 alcohol phosphatidyltransferase [Armatimonadota bacterium]